MSDKKIINMDDLMVDNLSLDNLVSLPNTPDASNDWKHKGEPAPSASVNAVDDLDISSVDLSVLDPEREVSESTYRGNTYFTPAPEETESAEPAAPAFTPAKGGITVEKFTPPTGGIEVGKISAPVTPPAPAPAPAPVPAPPRIEIPDPLDGMGLDLPPLKKVSVETPELPPIKPVSVEVPPPVTPVTPVSVEVPELPPLKSVAAGKTVSTELPPVKPVSVEIPELPPLKSVTAEKKADTGLPPMKQPANAGKTSDSSIPPLKPKAAEKKEDGGGLPPMKPITVGKKAEDKSAEDDQDLIKPSKRDDAPLPSDMSDVVAPKLDDMMEIKAKVADFQKPENALDGRDNPLANMNMSAARRKKLEEGFDAPVVMKQMDAATMQELRNNEMMERAEKGRTDVIVIAIIYLVLSSASLISDLSVNAGIGFAIDIVFAVCLFRGVRRARLLYIVWGIISAVVSWMGIAGVITLAKVGEITFTAMMWVALISLGLQSLFLFISSIMLLASKNIRAYYESL